MDSANSDTEKAEYATQDPPESISVDYETSQKLTRSLLLKLDTRILPTLAALFLCSFLDRTVIGNVKVLGFEKDINITNHQYDIGLTVFYLTYVCR
ncbi:hypothetical protein EYZ11_003047 [Aspergillus tanneri]|uniref:Major facilitator superfamily (MFS) profile domain-containing protein n=1 Tax=Aspergillus tanneri TaxID=1220188 RepID=A0A4S3JP57_9EURO|nr:hypothetical protein EYZ11_003047 [Aspergillus tanneri]